MKKAVVIICTIVIFAFSLIGCGDKDTVAYNLKLNVSSGEVAESFDTHGGFNGDGATFAKIKFSDDSALTQIENNNVWRSEERRVGKECRIGCRSRWSPYH